MQLARYLSENKITDAAFAGLLGVERQTVHRWKRGERIPRPDDMARIKTATGGKVTADDFMATATAEAS